MEYNNNVTWLLIYKYVLTLVLKLMEVRKSLQNLMPNNKKLWITFVLVLDFSWQLAGAPKQTLDEIFCHFQNSIQKETKLAQRYLRYLFMVMGCRQCWSLSVVQLKGKHCRNPLCCNGVVDTFGPLTIK